MSSISRTLSVGSDGRDITQFVPRKILPDKSQVGNFHLEQDESGSDDSSDDDDDEQFQKIDMEALRQRGKGVYICPKSLKCDKGGVDKDGNIVVFDRNSSFAYVQNEISIENDRGVSGHLSERSFADLSSILQAAL